ncbi:hypothetical protein R3P38DRAFT_2957163 [Favolaschia claudopus]|uniref:Protein kinase domain-containing protein n=1 Tax=Favolaschia claudopus TaxID=2862362 RepID=A0AAW0BB50_9AGAR
MACNDVEGESAVRRFHFSGGTGGRGGCGGQQGGNGGTGEGPRFLGDIVGSNLFLTGDRYEEPRRLAGAIRTNHQSCRASPYYIPDRKSKSNPDNGFPANSPESFAEEDKMIDTALGACADLNRIPNQIYAEVLLRQERGFPLCEPAPHSNLPEDYKRTGVSIGDVGLVTAEGFDFCFNVYRARDDSINAGGVPEDFVPLEMYSEVDVYKKDYEPGSYVGSPYPDIQEREADGSWGDFPGSALSFRCAGTTGALLALPCGSRVEELKNCALLRQHAERNAASWHRYITAANGRGRDLGRYGASLYLVTGCEKTQTGGIATFNKVPSGEQFDLSFKPSSKNINSGDGYRFCRASTRTFTSRRSEGELNDLLYNQTIFVRGFTITVNQTWYLRQTVAVKCVDGGATVELQRAKARPASSKRNSFPSRAGSEQRCRGCKRSDASMMLSLAPLCPAPNVFHPSRIINAEILRKAPKAAAVISHDDDWAEILRNDGSENVVRSVEEFMQQIRRQFQVDNSNGTLHLQRKTIESLHANASDISYSDAPPPYEEIEHSAEYNRLLGHPNVEIQPVMDHLQTRLDSDIPTYRRFQLVDAMLRLSRVSGYLPKCLDATPHFRNDGLVSKGNVFEVYRGEILEHPVVVRVVKAKERINLIKLRQQAVVWQGLNHPNILPTFGVFVLGEQYCLASPRMMSGNIKTFLNQCSSRANMLPSLTLDVAAGLKYLHEHSLVHGDLKGDNVLITSSTRACIANFGVQILSSTSSDKKKWTFASDVYDFGMVNLEMLSLHPLVYRANAFQTPTALDSIWDQLQAIWRNHPDKSMLDILHNQLQDCRTENPEMRPTATEIVSRLINSELVAKGMVPQSQDWDANYVSHFRQSLRLMATGRLYVDIKGRSTTR